MAVREWFDAGLLASFINEALAQLVGRVKISRVSTRSWSESPVVELLLRDHEAEGIPLHGFQFPGNVVVAVTYEEALRVRTGHEGSEVVLSHFYDQFDEFLDGEASVVLAQTTQELVPVLEQADSFGQVLSVGVYLRVRLGDHVFHTPRVVSLDHLFDEEAMGSLIERASRLDGEAAPNAG